MRLAFSRQLLCHKPLQWRHNELGGVSNHQPQESLLNRLFRRRSKKTSKLRVTGLCEGNSPVTGEFPAQRASNAENVSIWWRHYARPVFTFGWAGSQPVEWWYLRLLSHKYKMVNRYHAGNFCEKLRVSLKYKGHGFEITFQLMK